MAFRFWRRMKIAPGVTLNLSKRGGSLSFGPRGAKVTVGTSGARATAGLPGTGLYYTQKLKSPAGRTRSRSARAAAAAPTVDVKDRLDMGFFKRLVTPDDEEALIDGCREHVAGNEDAAYQHFLKAEHLTDGAYFAGFLALKRKEYDTAIRLLQRAASKKDQLGKLFSKYGLALTMSLSVTDEVVAHVGVTPRGVLLGLVEACQGAERWQEAIDHLKILRQMDPADIVTRVSLAELLLEVKGGDKKVMKAVAQLGEGIDNDSALHATLMLYQAKALAALGLEDGAIRVLTKAFRKKKDRPGELLDALQYERARLYETTGKAARARTEYEKLFARNSRYRDVAARLGL